MGNNTAARQFSQINTSNKILSCSSIWPPNYDERQCIHPFECNDKNFINNDSVPRVLAQSKWRHLLVETWNECVAKNRPLHDGMNCVAIDIRHFAIFKETITITWLTSIKRTGKNRNRNRHTYTQHSNFVLFFLFYRAASGDNGSWQWWWWWWCTSHDDIIGVRIA